MGIKPKFFQSKTQQVAKEPTRKNNILDLIFTNIAKFYVCPDTLAPLSLSDEGKGDQAN